MIDLHTLAVDYSELVRSALSSLQLQSVVLRNSAETDPAIDHIHDYIDANDLMAQALERQGYSLADCPEDVNEAWDRAKGAGYQLRRVLVACEFSGAVRDAINANGHQAMSCDLEPQETAGPHYQGDVRDIINDGWTDIVSFPPCTYLAGSGAKHLKGNPERQRLQAEALEFVRDVMAAPCERQALENSVGAISTAIRKPDQIVQPYQFGDDASKRTCLWLDNLPTLVADPADYVEPRVIEYRGKQVKRWSNQTPCGADRTAPGPDRWKIRSRTYPGIAKAMADQWFPAAA